MIEWVKTHKLQAAAIVVGIAILIGIGVRYGT
jgi:hypothetical protein